MKIRTLGKQLTFYDDKGNIVSYYPPILPEDPDEEVRMINIVDFEDRLMGIDPDVTPDFFIDIEETEAFIDRQQGKKNWFDGLVTRKEPILHTMWGSVLVFIFSLSVFLKMIMDL